MQNQGDSQKNEQTFTTIPTAEDPKRPKPLKKIAIIGSIVLLLVVIAAVAGIVTGYIKVSFGKETTIVQANSSSTCNTSVITNYNALVSVSSISEEERAAASQKIQDFVKEIENKSGFENDATCLFIVYATALSAGDQKKATEYAKKVEALANKGIFVDNRLSGVTSVKQMQATVEVITPSENGLQGRG